MWLGVMRRMMPDVDDLFAYIDVVAEKLGVHYRPLDMYLSTRLTAAASLDAGITTVIDACHNARSPAHTDAALDALQESGIRALHMVGAAMDKQASAAHLPGDLPRLAQRWNTPESLVRVGLFGQLNLDWWQIARDLDMRILTEFIGDLVKLGPEFAKPACWARITFLTIVLGFRRRHGSYWPTQALTSPLIRVQMRCLALTTRASLISRPLIMV